MTPTRGSEPDLSFTDYRGQSNKEHSPCFVRYLLVPPW